jgi:hypothetical protein
MKRTGSLGDQLKLRALRSGWWCGASVRGLRLDVAGSTERPSVKAGFLMDSEGRNQTLRKPAGRDG